MRIDATTRLFVVTDPQGPDSTLPDICFATDLNGLRLQFAGGLTVEDRPTIYTSEDEAFEEVGAPEVEAAPVSAVGEFATDEPPNDVVEDLREIEGIGAPPEKADVDEGQARKKKWRMFRKGGDA